VNEAPHLFAQAQLVGMAMSKGHALSWSGGVGPNRIWDFSRRNDSRLRFCEIEKMQMFLGL